MFRYEPPDGHRIPYSPAELRARARELVLLELKYQPVLKACAFAAGFGAGVAASLGLGIGAFFIFP